MNFKFPISDSAFGWFQLGVDLLMGVCVAAILIAVVINFSLGGEERDLRQKKKSRVATGTMLVFFGLFIVILKTGTSCISIHNIGLRFSLSVLGLLIVILGTVVNIRGRLALGNKWANQIKIYQEHSLVTRDVYRIVRHPLYASTLWMFYGAALVHSNWVALVGTTVVFLPTMVYRARQEENLLIKEFAEYQQYRALQGCFSLKSSKG